MFMSEEARSSMPDEDCRRAEDAPDVHGFTALTACEPSWPGPISPELDEIDFDQAKRVAVNLTHREIRMLAQLHVDQLHGFSAYAKGGGDYSGSDVMRARYHGARFDELQAFLGERDQSLFRELCRSREAFIATIQDPEDHQ